MTESTRETVSRPVVFAGGIAIGWVVLEFLLRRGVVSLLGSSLTAAFVVDWTVLLLGFPAMAVVLSVIARRMGQQPDAWGYEWSIRAVGAGLLGVVIAIALAAVTAQIDATLFGLEQAGTALTGGTGEVLRETPLLAVVLLLGNGIAGPIAEEQVWRAIVQTEFVRAWGAVAGVLFTAVLFALKHVVVDLSIARITTLLALGLVLGVVRHRYGTVSSVTTHIGMNLLSTASIVLVAVG